jgi:hypothetical protein
MDDWLTDFVENDRLREFEVCSLLAFCHLNEKDI